MHSQSVLIDYQKVLNSVVPKVLESTGTFRQHMEV